VRITIVSAYDDPARGGAEKYLHRLKERIRARGHEVGPDGDVTLASMPHPGCDFYQPHHGIYAESIPPHYQSMPLLARLVREYNPWRIRHFARLRRAEAETIAGAQVLALSPRVVRDLEKHYPGARHTLLRPGVNLERFRPGGARPGGRALFVATNPRLKGLKTARAAADLAGVELVVAQAGEDVAELYRVADVLVHPTWYDTASLVVLEALASGTPPVTTVRDGNADLAIEGGGAALERPGDSVALADAIREVIARADAGRCRAVAERFDETEMLDRVVEVLTSRQL
jgi:glycosyltransferase involved in cell wall biosynthesis